MTRSNENRAYMFSIRNQGLPNRLGNDPGWLRRTSSATVRCGFWANTPAWPARSIRAASKSSCGAIAVRSWARCSVRPPIGRRGSWRTRSGARSSARRRPRTAAEARIGRDRRRGFATCREFIAKRRLQMDLVDVETIFGRERMVFYYLAEKRVDFRELVKDLARAFQTRIEMRQIGVRDEAKLLADYGDCGKPVCCNTHLTRMPPVSMRMAKIQKTTLDPSKISGRCGRLKCCLRYEFDTYRALERDLPAVGSSRAPPWSGPGAGPGSPRPKSGRRVRGSAPDHDRIGRHPERGTSQGPADHTPGTRRHGMDSRQ